MRRITHHFEIPDFPYDSDKVMEPFRKASEWADRNKECDPDAYGHMAFAEAMYLSSIYYQNDATSLLGGESEWGAILDQSVVKMAINKGCLLGYFWGRAEANLNMRPLAVSGLEHLYLPHRQNRGYFVRPLIRPQPPCETIQPPEPRLEQLHRHLDDTSCRAHFGREAPPVQPPCGTI